MKQFFVLFICIIYTFVSFGGTIYMHKCSGKTAVSIYQKSTHTECQMCDHHQEDEGQKKEAEKCKSGQCSDVAIKLDQSSEKVFSSQKDIMTQISPAILYKFWIILKPFITETQNLSNVGTENSLIEGTSSPTYILNCLFRI